MPTINDVSIVNSNTAPAAEVESGLERTLCSPSLCGSKHLSVYRRTIRAGRALTLDAGDGYALGYVMSAAPDGKIVFGLHAQPDLRTGRKIASQPERGVGGDAPLAVGDVADAPDGHVQIAGELVAAYAQRLHRTLQQNRARMGCRG